MTEREYSHTEKRRTEGTAGRRYQHGGRQDRQWERQGGQTGQQMGGATGGQMGQQSSYQSGGGMGQQSGGQTGQQSTGQMGSHSGGRTSRQTGGQTGQQTGHTGGSRMGSGRTGSGQMGGEWTGQQSGQMSGGQMSGGQMGGGQTSGGQISQQGGQMGSRMGGQQTGQQVGQMGGQSSQQRPVRPVRVRDVAATNVVTTQPDAPLTEVVQKMSREDVGSVVITEGNTPVGIITDRKVALALGETADVSQLRAADVMSEELYTVPEGTNVFDLVRRLSDKGVRRVPVVGDRGDLKGIVSLDDVIVLLAEEFYDVSEIIRKQSPRF